MAGGNGMTSGRQIGIAIVDNDALLLDFEASAIHQMYPRERLLWVTDDPWTAIDRCCAEVCLEGASACASGNVQDAALHMKDESVVSPSVAAKNDDCPDVLIVDMSMGEMPGPDVCRIIRERTSRIALVGVTSYSLNAYSQEALDCGAQCLIDKSSLARVIHAAEAVESGQYLDPSWNSAEQGDLHVPALGRRVFFDHAEGIVSRESTEESHARLFRRMETGFGETAKPCENGATALSNREMQVLEEYSHGVKIRSIAHRLGLTESSVKTYLSRAREKYQAVTTWELLHKLGLM
ncbi:response regulator [Pseudoscardovia suis]|nr:response regulator [Pseudoscardovia suis]